MSKNINEKLLSFEDIETKDTDLENLNKLTKYNYFPKDKEELKELLKKLIRERGINANLNDICTSQITDMGSLFAYSQFNGDISEWDVHNVKDMSYMFYYSFFNGDISEWNVSNVEDMSYIFDESSFNGDISNWDVSNVEDMDSMFYDSSFNGDISDWDVSNVEDMRYMFYKSKFNGDISNWDVSNVESMRYMFQQSKFTKKEELLLNWKFNPQCNRSFMFYGCGINNTLDEKLLSFEDKDSEDADLENLNELTKYNYYPKDKEELYDIIDELIKERGRNANLNDVCTSRITDMSYLFYESRFNGDISKWDVSNVENMSAMFCSNSYFNGDISKWNVSKVTNMTCMFAYSVFNGDISNWDVSNVVNMAYMFYKSKFNRDISKWNINPDCYTRQANFPNKEMNEKLLSFEDVESEDTDLENLNEISKIAERKKWLEEFKNPEYEGNNICSFLDYYLTSRYTKECAKYKSYQGIKGDTVLINTTNYKPLVDETGEYIFKSASFWYYDGFGFYIDHRNTNRWNRINFVNFDGKLFFKNDIFNIKRVIYCKDDGNIFVCFKPLKTSRDYIVNQKGDVYRFLKQYNIYSLNSEYDTSKEFLSMLEAFETSLNVKDDDFLNKIKLIEAKEVNEKLLSFEDTKTEDNDLENLNELTKYNYFPKTRDELEALVNELIEERGNNANLNDIYTGDITDMSRIFYDSKFNGDISKWDVHNVKDMSYMFYYSFFNGDISEWNVSNVENMAGMFSASEFNGDISKWDVSNVRNMNCMFCSSAFNRDISKWDVSNVENMTGLFYASPFTCNISNWNINPKCVTKFANFPFKKKVNEKLLSFKDTETKDNDLENLNELTKYNYFPKTREELVDIVDKLIEERGFNADLNDIYTSNITSMAYLFFNINFNGDISKWDVSNVKSMEHMFENSNFNGDISKWNVSNVEDMASMFYNSKFNGDISKWNVSNVEDMSYIFDESSFNGDVSDWNINLECNIKYANFPNKEIYEKLLSFEDTEIKNNDLENFKKFEDVAARKKEFEENWEYLGDERYECNDLYRRVAKYKKLNGGSKIIDTCNFLINNGSYELLFPLTDEYQFHNVTRFTYLGPKYNLYAARASRIIKDKNDLLKIRPKGGVAFFEYNIIFNDGTFLFPEWVSKYYIVPDIAMDELTKEPFFNIRSSEAGITFRFYFNGDIIDISQQPWTKLPKDMTIDQYCKLKIKNES